MKPYFFFVISLLKFANFAEASEGTFWNCVNLKNFKEPNKILIFSATYDCAAKALNITGNVLSRGPAQLGDSTTYVHHIKCATLLFVLDLPNAVTLNQIAMTCDPDTKEWNPVSSVPRCVPQGKNLTLCFFSRFSLTLLISLTVQNVLAFMRPNFLPDLLWDKNVAIFSI